MIIYYKSTIITKPGSEKLLYHSVGYPINGSKDLIRISHKDAISSIYNAGNSSYRILYKGIKPYNSKEVLIVWSIEFIVDCFGQRLIPYRNWIKYIEKNIYDDIHYNLDLDHNSCIVASSKYDKN